MMELAGAGEPQALVAFDAQVLLLIKAELVVELLLVEALPGGEGDLQTLDVVVPAECEVAKVQVL